MTIYLDVVLLENICMNYIILFATGYIMKIKMKQWRLITSGTVGGIYAVVSYLEILPIYSGMFMKVFFSLIMVYLAFNSKTIKLLIKQLVIFYLTSFVFGGCAFALLYFVKVNVCVCVCVCRAVRVSAFFIFSSLFIFSFFSYL